MQFANIRFKNINGNLSPSYSLNVTDTVPDITKMVMILGICPNLQSRDYCEAGRNMTVKNFGRLFTDKSSVWYNILQFKPPVTFPLKPGLYEALNDPTKSVYPVVQRTSWLLKILMYYEDEVLLCNICEGEMFE
ncbi:unnamed protein product [Acanthoscelides obtectus]|uniref:Uncharacterized protein n=1 Tax=Acanthoscelides obtectus TaxID=200917 RepID=A0A9P0KM63_ACAOB|nr:unnamed protein product [Acanthoscelides obtectus]CAK1631761.1 hypothetical protein AOBTE_LOCUS7140 [Acanthoscelides obtectus]